MQEHATTIRVRYPADGGEIRLRTDLDWERDIVPDRVGADGRSFDFVVPDASPFRYFKPVLLRGGEWRWSVGENFLLRAGAAGAREVYPWFHDDARCSACELHRIPSSAGGREHAVRVFYPAGYHENPLERFPVVYMQDGQNLFFPDEAFAGHDWKIDETLDVLTGMNLVRRVIVVGIYPADRVADYTHPGYEAYARYLVDDVKPWVDANYRTIDGPRSTAVMGSSLGGVASLHLAWTRPDVIGHAACLSSTFGWRDDLFDRIAGEPKRPIRIYLDSGWPRDNYEVTLAMRDLLLRRGYGSADDLLHLAFPHARHDERSWSMRAHIPLQHFFRVAPRSGK